MQPHQVLSTVSAAEGRRLGTSGLITGEIDEGVIAGYLLLADISGYTTFLTGTELEHSHAIVTELTKLIRATLSPPMRFVKLEGDALFCFAPQAAFPSGEFLVELVESCYFDFTNRLLNMTRSTSPHRRDIRDSVRRTGRTTPSQGRLRSRRPVSRWAMITTRR